MNIVVAGASGRVGQRIVKQLSEASVDSRSRINCLTRSVSLDKSKNLFQDLKNVDIKVMNYEATETVRSDLISAMEGCTTVICALGALESDAFNWKAPLQIDGLLSQEIIDAAVASPSVRNFILVSSLGTDRIGWPASILNLFWGILSWKRQTEIKLIDSGLNYFIVRPGGMEKPTDDFEIENNMMLHQPSTKFGGLISRKQVASLCVASALNQTLVTNRIVEVTADPTYPKLSAVELLASLPIVVDERIWRTKLTSDEFYVLREAGTERPWTSRLNDEKRKGEYNCAGCGTPLFPSGSKFESGTGWPSFNAPLEKSSVVERTDFMMGMARTEVLCSNCGGHLGHVFPDGPKPTGLRYCMNGVSLKFAPGSDQGEFSKQTDKLAERMAEDSKKPPGKGKLETM
eukprot:CAMPEP_0119043400 /NCGR_PEP_ID=MMETSP1177-20130426/21554_1 /TAXON_ID=2985 /ORGANISM="Ochromonas sp, Strain CCMP1899" /LENGTH=402 /DNA_ID=CAMNT_0007011405 /DNA_START=98 /DNA_END=1306 /DNA_ORIENTATION=+